jgi:hypothetical protein
MGKGLEEILRDLQRQIAPPTLAFFIISDFEEEGQVERRAPKKKEKIKQPIEIKQLVEFSSKTIKRGFFDVEVDSLYILVVPTKSRSKYMMRCKGKEQLEEGSSFAKVT